MTKIKNTYFKQIYTVYALAQNNLLLGMKASTKKGEEIMDNVFLLLSMIRASQHSKHSTKPQ